MRLRKGWQGGGFEKGVIEKKKGKERRKPAVRRQYPDQVWRSGISASCFLHPFHRKPLQRKSPVLNESNPIQFNQFESNRIDIETHTSSVFKMFTFEEPGLGFPRHRLCYLVHMKAGESILCIIGWLLEQSIPILLPFDPQLHLIRRPTHVAAAIRAPHSGIHTAAARNVEKPHLTSHGVVWCILGDALIGLCLPSSAPKAPRLPWKLYPLSLALASADPDALKGCW